MAKNDETITIPIGEFEELKKANSVMAESIAILQKRLDDLTRAAMTGAGMDPAIAVRKDLPTVLVQFTKEYNRGSIPSEVQKGAMVFQGYSCREGEIVQLKQDEVERLEADRPGLLITNKKDFVPQFVYRMGQKMDKKTGQVRPERIKEEIPAEDLIKAAVVKG